ncbi:CMRF35-like molecule 7 [Mirounga leonina]|uniref:CMRF35-like molecule 7 n=1 Tax=Mirounga leonina TaxID=9715 RepID=UPI00156C4321|nr:CMRF35-like molecule 7 [Mirounga leonina]XP_034864601.1 CMRF35-like molecule 7 [Mirounga leonina]XP_034879785.1 CMRF35-like molecule 7 [Mirounga leonina]
MWLLPVLFLLIIQGHFSICQERTVRGTEGGTLTTNCEYGRGWEPYKKWWCRGKNWNSCRILVKTTGSEQLVKKGRATIQDYHNQRTITMTLEGLRLDDTDTYWCGIERIGEDLGYKFSVIVDPAPDPTDFPKPVTRPTTASWDSTFPFTLGINSTQPVTLINPDSRSGTLASTVAAKKPPVWILLMPLFFIILEWLCQG